jgi:Ca2+-transporting ATPase
MDQIWHQKSSAETIELLESSENGLSDKEAKERLKKYGFNKLPEVQGDGLAVIFFNQFKSPLIYILFLAAIIVFLTGETIDAAIITFVLFFNAIFGTIQEGRAQNTLAALRKFVQTSATVLREGNEIIISDSEVVQGDILILQEGEKIPADARLLAVSNLIIDEATLTGESKPVHKSTEAVSNSEAILAEQSNMAFKGTNIILGNGRAIVVATGQDTIIGKISQEISLIDTEIPLRVDIRNLSRFIIIAVVAICFSIFFLGVAYGKSLAEMFSSVVSLSVSIIPEGLPVVMTLVLAGGVWRMSKKNTLVKKLQAVEALGQADILAVDKTGTLTKNEMTAQKLYAGGNYFDISGMGYDFSGSIFLEKNIIEPLNHQEVILAGKISAFCASARVSFVEKENYWRVSGDPTEAAMLVFAEKVGFNKNNLEEDSPRVAEIPFDPKIKYHAVLHKMGDSFFLAVTGAPEEILSLSTNSFQKGKCNLLSSEEYDETEKAILKMSQSGLRVVAFAYKEIKDAITEISPDLIKDLNFVGLLGIKDALRKEAALSVRKSQEAGLKVIMITGDHKITARSIAIDAGIFKKGDKIISGHEIDRMSEEELANNLDDVSVFARVNPEHKLKIINAYKKRGNIIAMTGDGVNDAPSLVAADLGVAMGKIGTEVAKEAADIIILDDNFGSITAAIEEGRNIYKTIKKVILYLFSTSLGEVLTIAVALLLGFPLPILAAQILWLNMVTDGFLDVALAMEPKEDNLIKNKYIKSKNRLVDWLMIPRMISMALPMMVGTLYLFQKYAEIDLEKAWTISLTTLAVFQWFNAWNCRHEKKSIFGKNIFANKFLVGATAIVIFLQMLALYNPFFQKILRTVPLSGSEWISIILIASSIIWVEEIRKFFHRLLKRE